ncbi:MAG: YhjD/YihY/BrkB family envelope integrity protein, partial [Spirillospora sp.]
MTTVSGAAGVSPAGDPDPDTGPGRLDGRPDDTPDDSAGRDDPAGRDGQGSAGRGGERDRERPSLSARLGGGVGASGRVGWTLVKGTAVGAFRYRVTGLAAEAAFFALLSLPPLVIGLIGTMGHLRGVIGPDTVNDIRNWVIENSRQVLTGSVVDDTVEPLLKEVIDGGRVDIVSVSFLISLWAGSRATNVYVDTITIAYGMSGMRGVIRTRLRAFLLYLIGLL